VFCRVLLKARLDKFYEAESGSRAVDHSAFHSTGNAQVDRQSMIAHVFYIGAHEDPTYLISFPSSPLHHYTSAVL
jgi:hypothetical protein